MGLGGNGEILMHLSTFFLSLSTPGLTDCEDLNIIGMVCWVSEITCELGRLLENTHRKLGGIRAEIKGIGVLKSARL